MTAPDFVRMEAEGVTLVHARLPSWEAGERVTWSAPSSIGFSFTRQHCAVEDDGRSGERVVEAETLFVRGGAPLAWLRVATASELVEVSAGPALRQSVAEELGVPMAADLGDLADGSGPLAWPVAARLRGGLRSGDLEVIEAEALTRLLYGQVLTARFGGRMREKGDGALDRRRLVRVTDYIEVNIGAALSLTRLAEQAALSPFHFQRSFRRATGVSPHRYVAMRRAQRAWDALSRGEAPAPNRFGFSSRAQMLRALRRHIGAFEARGQAAVSPFFSA